MPNLEQFDTAEKIKEAMDALASKYEVLISEQRAAGLKEARLLIAKFNLSAEELKIGASEPKARKSSPSGRRTRRTAEEIAADKAAASAKAMYRDAETGIEWSGKGRPPKVFKGKNMADYLIQ